MPRVKRGSSRRQKRKKILARAKGYYQAKSKLYRYAKEAVDRGLKFAYIGRRLKKRDFRSLWIIRIGAGARQHGLSYSRFMHGLKLAGIAINRKMLAEMAVRDPDAFGKLAAQVSGALAAPRAKQPEADRSPVGEPAATEDEAKVAESPAPVAEAAPAKAVKAAAAGAKGVGQAAAVPARAVEVEVKETAESPPAEAKPAKKARQPTAKKAASKTVPEEESSVSGAAPKATKPAAKPAKPAKKVHQPAAKTSTAAKAPKSSAGAKKKAAKPSKAAPKSPSKGTGKSSKATASD